MAGRLSDAEALAAEALDFGLQIGAPDAFAMYAGQFFVLGTFAGRHARAAPSGGTSGSRESLRASLQAGVRDHLRRSGSRRRRSRDSARGHGERFRRARRRQLLDDLGHRVRHHRHRTR